MLNQNTKKQSLVVFVEIGPGQCFKVCNCTPAAAVAVVVVVAAAAVARLMLIHSFIMNVSATNTSKSSHRKMGPLRTSLLFRKWNEIVRECVCGCLRVFEGESVCWRKVMFEKERISVLDGVSA